MHNDQYHISQCYRDWWWSTTTEIDKQPQGFWGEVQDFRHIIHYVSEFCADITAILKNDSTVIYTFGSQGTKISIHGVIFYAVDCAITNLHLKVFRNTLRVRQNPDLCFSTKLKHFEDSLQFIRWRENKKSIYINKLLCSKWHPFYNFPLDILAEPKAYLWYNNDDLEY